MKIYESAVRKPISTILIFAGVIIFGLFSLKNLAIDMYPEMDMPTITVMTTYEGANASDIETNVTRVLEDNLNTVSNLKEITSTSQDNLSLITLEFEWGSDLDEASNDVRDAINRIRSYLPDDIDDPSIFKFNSSMIPVMVLTATAEQSYAALDKILDEKLVNRLNRIDGVGAVTVLGAPVREIQVNVDPRKIEAYNLSVEQIGSIIAAENINIPSGTIDIGNNTYNVKADVEFDSSDDLNSIVVASVGGKDILLRDVATIRDTLEKETLDERINGRKGVRIIVQKQSGANTVAIVEDIQKALPSIEAGLPDDVEIGMVMDGSESIRDSIASLEETILFAFLFVILVVLFFLGRWRATFIICLTIPVSLVVSFIYLFITGSTLNIISLSSLSIAIGMVVDDAIVVLENITKHIERGSSPKEAAIYATNEVWLAVIATTLTVVAVFMPLTMLTGMSGVMFKELGWIVSLVVCVSTIAAITLTPMLSSKLLRGDTVHDYKGLGIIFKPIDRFLTWLDDAYARLLTWAVHHRTAVLGIALLIFAASLLLLRKVPTEFFPATDNGIISATVELEQNIGVNFTSKIARRIDSIINVKYPEVEMVSTSAGTSSSSTMSLFSSGQGSYIINYMMKLPQLSRRNSDRTIYQIGDLLREDLAAIPEIRRFTVTPGGQTGGMGSGSNIEVQVYGYDFNVTNDIATDLKDRIAAIPGTRDVKLSRDDLRPEYNVKFDRNKLAYYGLNSSTAGSYIRNRLNGLTATLYREDGEEYDVNVRYDEPFRSSLNDISDILVYNQNGNALRVGDVGTITEEFAPPKIERDNRQRVVSVQASLADGVPLGTVMQGINTILADYEVPDEVYIDMGGSIEDQQEAFGDLMTLFGLIVVLVYIVMATQFESLVMPFIIMFTLPFAFTGVFLLLYITGTPLSIVALIGAIMLVGIVVKNGIVMVDFINLLRERGQSVNQSVIASGKSRLRPVLMTSLTTILGMLPMALGIGTGSEIWQPMGIAVIGGLTFSTLLTLLVVPVVYSVFGGRAIKQERAKMALYYNTDSKAKKQ